MRRILTLLGLSLLLPGCPGDDAGTDSGACNCPAPTAIATSYDNVSSMLGGDNVQDAVDELAARPIAEAPLGGRLETITNNGGGAGTATVTAECSNQANDLAIGGSCGPGGSNVTLISAGIDNGTGVARYSCSYQGATINAQVQALCLKNAR